METSEIQKEFEVLVAELERLKNINQLTSSNAEAAKSVIDEVENFTMSVKQFKAAVDKDYEKKAKDIERLMEHASDTFSSIERRSEKNIKDVSNELKSFSSKTEKSLRREYLDLKKEVNNYFHKLNALKGTLKTDFENYSLNAVKAIDDREAVLEAHLKEIDKAIKIGTESVESKFQSYQISFEKKAKKTNLIFLVLFALVLILLASNLVVSLIS